MRHRGLQAMLMAIVAAGLAGVAAPARAETVFRSAEVAVTAISSLGGGAIDHSEITQSDETLAARRMVAEAETRSVDLFFGGARSTIGATAEFDADGSRAILSIGFGLAVVPRNGGSAASGVRYAFRYQFDVTTTSRFIDDWTVTFPQSVLLSLSGPAGPALPLGTPFGSHSVLLAPGSYEMLLFTEQQPGSTDYSVSLSPQAGIGFAELQAADFYSFQIVPAPTAAVPEPASWATTLAGAALCGLAAARRRHNARHAVPGAPKT